MLAVELELDGGEPLVGGGAPMDLRTGVGCEGGVGVGVLL